MLKIKVGSVFDTRYSVLSELGKGGMGEVFLARQLDADRTVALKILAWGEVSDEGSRKRFLREFKALASLNHPNIMTFYHMAITDKGILYAACEYIEGKNLRSILNDDGKFEWQRLLKILIQICSAMIAAHEQGILHRDLKPENIMLINNSEDKIKIIDFGLSCLIDADESRSQKLTFTGQLLGTVHYMSPEQCAGESLDQRSDIYSLACVIFDLLSGEKLFEADNAVGIINKQRFEDPKKRLQILAEHVPDELIRIMEKMLSKNKEERYPSMSALKAELEELLSNKALHVITSCSVSRSPGNRNLAYIAVLAVLGVVIATLLIGSLLRKPNEKKAPESDPALKKEADLELELSRHKYADSLRLAEVMITLAELKGARKEFEAAEPLLLKGIAIRKGKLGANSFRVLTAEKELAEVYVALGRMDDAIKHERNAERALREIVKNRSGDMELAALFADMGGFFKKVGLMTEADSCLKSALKVSLANENTSNTTFIQYLEFAIRLKEQQHYSEAEQITKYALQLLEHSDQKDSKSHTDLLRLLGEIYQLQGDFAKAEAVGRSYLQYLERTGGGETLNFCNVLNDLASTCQNQRRFADAEKFRERAILIAKTKLDTDKIRELEWSNALLQCCVSGGNFSKARALAQDCGAQALRIEKLRDNNPNPLISVSESLEYLERFSDSRAVLMHCLTLFKSDNPAENKERIRIFMALARSYNSSYNYAEAANFSSQAFELIGKLGSSDATFAADNKLGWINILISQGRYDEALSLSEELEKDKKVSNELDLLKTLGQCNWSIGKENRASLYFNRAIDWFKHDLQKDSDNVWILSNIANLYCQDVHYDLSIPCYQRAKSLAASKRTLQGLSEEASILCGLGGSQRMLWQFQEAARSCQESLKLTANSDGVYSLNYAGRLNDLALTYSILGKSKDAEAFQIESLDKIQSCFGKDSLRAAWQLNSIAQFYSEKQDYTKADKYFEDALKIYNKTARHGCLNAAIVTCDHTFSYMQEGKYAEAEKLIRACLAYPCINNANQHRAQFNQILALILHKSGRSGQAAPLIRTLLSAPQEELRSINNIAAAHIYSPPYWLKITGRLRSADSYLRAWIELGRTNGASAVQIATGYSMLADLCIWRGKRNEADEAFKQCMDIWEREHWPAKPIVIESVQNYARFLQMQHRSKEAAGWAAKASALQRLYAQGSRR